MKSYKKHIQNTNALKSETRKEKTKKRIIKKSKQKKEKNIKNNLSGPAHLSSGKLHFSEIMYMF